MMMMMMMMMNSILSAGLVIVGCVRNNDICKWYLIHILKFACYTLCKASSWI